MAVFDDNASSIKVSDSSSKNYLERNTQMLSEINTQSIIYQKNNEQEKFNEQTVLMQDTLESIANDSLGRGISMSYVYKAYFPLVAGSQVEIQEYLNHSKLVVL